MVPVLLRLLIGTVAASLFMIALWFRQRATKNAGIVDVGWAGAIGVVGVFFALCGDGYLPRRILIASLIAIWSSRLTTYLYFRVHGEAEDGRYAKLRKDWGNTFQQQIFWFYQMQAATVIVFAATMLVGSGANRQGLDWLDFFGVVLCLVGVGGVAISDTQLARYRKKPTSKGKTCREGLWAFSRHPNYFFESIHWWAYVPIAFGAPAWWVTIIVPVTLLYLLLFVTISEP